MKNKCLELDTWTLNVLPINQLIYNLAFSSTKLNTKAEKT